MKRITALILTCLLSVGLLCGCGAQQPEPALPEIIIGSDTYRPTSIWTITATPPASMWRSPRRLSSGWDYRRCSPPIDWEQKKTLVDSGEIDCSGAASL